jgi:probable rRNA maturation factor
MSINITKTVKVIPKLPYLEVKLAVLGKNYDLTLVFIGPEKARSLNQTTRQKDYVPNVLSFPLDKNTGEIYITPAIAKKEAEKFSLSVDGYIGYLFIHGLLHLKGLDHGTKMDQAEKRLLKKFSFK